MDRLTVVSGLLFLAADIFALVSLAMPDWIVSYVGGKVASCSYTYLLLLLKRLGTNIKC